MVVVEVGRVAAVEASGVVEAGGGRMVAAVAVVVAVEASGRAFCSSGCAIELVVLVHSSLLVSVLYSHRCAIEHVCTCPCV